MTHALTKHTPAQPRTLDAHTMTFADMLVMGNALVTTGFLPEHIKTGAQAAAIIATGRELGMQPMRSLRSLNMVKGKVTENADSQLARFKSDGGHASFQELTHKRAVLHLVHPNGDKHDEEFTMQDAVAAGLAGKGGMYEKHAKAMLRSRVITAGLKSIGWEGGAGTYDPEELAPPRVQRDAVNEAGLRAVRAPMAIDDAIVHAELEEALDGMFTHGDNADEPIEVGVAVAPVASRGVEFNADEPLKFGKYKGRSMRDIAVDDIKYLGWLYGSEREKAVAGDRYAKSAEWLTAFRAFIKGEPEPVVVPQDVQQHTPDYTDDIPF